MSRPGLAQSVGIGVGILLLASVPPGRAAPLPESGAASARTVLVVMDPLARELSCACVKGYGQRDYRKLAARLGAALQQPVAIEFTDDLAETLDLLGPTTEVIVIGDRGSTAAAAERAGLKAEPVCALTGPDGSSGLDARVLGRAGDPAQGWNELRGRRVLFGIPEADARHSAVRSALRAAGVELPPTVETRPAYNVAALDVLDSTTSPPPVAVVPGYALRLLEGCGTVKPGELKVIAQTEPLPFITVFLDARMPPPKAETLRTALLEVKKDPGMLQALETRDGFQPILPNRATSPQAQATPDWPDWRGPGRDGRVRQLPARLPSQAKFLWKKATLPGGLAGLGVSRGRVILSERNLSDTHDVYRCLDAETGTLLWRAEFPARGKPLDYGQSPRATPVIEGDRVYVLGAFGGLRCLELADGERVWERDLPREFRAPLPTWGMCATPLVVDGLVIVNPGATNASLAALDAGTGATRWTTPGAPAAYASFICACLGGRRQIVGYDQDSIGGWDLQSGARLWRLVPPEPGDFNVPTPIVVPEGLVLATENNGTRLYAFDTTGGIVPRAVGSCSDLSPDTTTPVVTSGRVFGVHAGLYCLDLKAGLKPVWRMEDDALDDHAALLADAERVLVATLGGELILLDARADHARVLSRLRVFEDETELYPHPALAGSRLYLRGGSQVACLDLDPDHETL